MDVTIVCANTVNESASRDQRREFLVRRQAGDELQQSPALHARARAGADSGGIPSGAGMREQATEAFGSSTPGHHRCTYSIGSCVSHAAAELSQKSCKRELVFQRERLILHSVWVAE